MPWHSQVFQTIKLNRKSAPCIAGSVAEASLCKSIIFGSIISSLCYLQTLFI
jgi:hypothetical protein